MVKANPKIEIRTFWDAIVGEYVAPVSGNTIAEVLASGNPILLCEIEIDGKLKGRIFYDGSKVYLEKKKRRRKKT